MAALPLVIAGLSGLGSAALRYGGQRQQAKAMFTEEDEARLAELQRGIGLSPAQLGAIQAQHAAMRGGVLADAQQRQLQQAQAMSGSGAISARDLFNQEVGLQQVQGQMLNLQAQAIRDATELEIAKGEAEKAQLKGAKSQAEVLNKAGLFNLGADALSVGAEAGITALGQKAMADASNKYLAALDEQDQVAMRRAAMEAANAQIALQVSGAYGDAAPTLPSYYQGALSGWNPPADYQPGETWEAYNARKLAEQAAEQAAAAGAG
jgi:hypothetical protein